MESGSWPSAPAEIRSTSVPRGRDHLATGGISFSRPSRPSAFASGDRAVAKGATVAPPAFRTEPTPPFWRPPRHSAPILVNPTPAHSSRSYWEASREAVDRSTRSTFRSCRSQSPSSRPRSPARGAGLQAELDLNYWHVVDERRARRGLGKASRALRESRRRGDIAALVSRRYPFCRCCRRTPRLAAAYWRARP